MGRLPAKLLVVGAATLALGAAASDQSQNRQAPAPDRARVSGEVQKRTGRPLRPEAPARPPTGGAAVPPGVVLEPELSEDAAVATALWNNAALEVALSELGLAKADLLEAGLLRNPAFQVLFPVGPKPFESVLQWPVEALWQRPRRVAAARLNLEAVSSAVVQSGLDLARDVRVAYADLGLAQQRAAVGRQSAELRERIAALTEKRLAAGDISEMEASLPRVDARSAADQAQRFAREVEAARERLRLLLGLRGDRTALRAGALGGEARQLPEWPDLLKTALEARPDLRAAEVQVEAAARRARWERSRVLALVTPLLSVKDVGTAGVRAGPGLAAEIPLLQRNQGAVSRADAEVTRAAMRYAALRDQVELGIREGQVLYNQAAESLERLREQVRPEVERSIRLAERAYADGEVSYLFVLETTRQLYDVRIREMEAAASLRKALAQLERSVGTKL